MDRRQSDMRGMLGVVLVLGCVVSATVEAAAVRWLDQGWSAGDRSFFYTASQGSRIMPYAWFMALERPDSETLFRADSLTRFGYLPNSDPNHNPDGLPIGFVEDRSKDGNWIGMTCAACHTNQVEFASTPLQIDGGPADADMYGLIDELARALAQTSVSGSAAKFQRFAARVLGAGAAAGQVDALYIELQRFAAYFTQYVHDSTPPTPWGRARLDAFGMIFNRVTSIDLGIPTNSHPPNAPVSYPFLWDTHYHNVVQWNGSAPNLTPVERLARNVGEVLGVFAQVDFNIDPRPPLNARIPLYFKTSARRDNQLRLEARLAALRSPGWPEDLAPIDPVKRDAGRILYQQHCVSCHALTPRSQPLRPTEVAMIPIAEVGTDATMASNAFDLGRPLPSTGILAGVRMPPFIGKRLGAQAPSIEVVFTVVVGAILQPLDAKLTAEGMESEASIYLNAVESGGPNELSSALRAAVNNLMNSPNIELLRAGRKLIEAQSDNTKALRYKARPLDGIWATAPYLHNGSVPNLYELLLPVQQRSPQFEVGTREFDVKNVGFSTAHHLDGFLFDTRQPGNSNAGHDSYGTDAMSETQRYQLVEYLKSL